MVRVKELACLLLAALLAGTAAAQGDLSGFVSRIPQCGLTCIVQEIPLSACNTLTNSTCICTDEKLRAATQACILKNCKSALDGIETAKVEAEACQRPYRDRRSALLGPLVIEVVAWFSVWVRLYGRWSTMRKFEADDWIMLVALIIYTPFMVIGNYIGQLAFGRDVWTVAPGHIVSALRLFYVASSMYIVLLALTKISLLCFFLRVFPNARFRWATFAAMLYIGVAATIIVFMQIFQCLPIRYNWERLGDFGPHRCLNINALAYTSAGVSISQDILILVLPLPLLLGLNMSWRNKIGIIIMFSLGTFILVTSCIRLQFLVVFAQSTNPTWDNMDAFLWTGLEVAVSILVTSLPAIRILLVRMLSGFFTTIVSKASGKSDKSGQSVSAKKSLTGTTSQQSRVGDSKNDDQMRRKQELQEEAERRQRRRDEEEQQWRRDEERRRRLQDEEQQRQHQQQRQWLQQQQEQIEHQQQIQHHQPLRSGRRTPQYLPPIPRSKFNIHIFGWGSRSASRTSGGESEEELELGDRIQGEVHTEIGVANGGVGNEVYGYDAFYQESSVESGIHVHTRTTIDSWHRPPGEAADRWPNR